MIGVADLIADAILTTPRAAPGGTALRDRLSTTLDAFRVGTTQGTYLCSAAGGSGLTHSFLPDPAGIVVLLRPHRETGLGLLFNDTPFRLRAGESPDQLHLVRMLSCSAADRTGLGDPIGTATLCALPDWSSASGGPTEFRPDHPGLHEQFYLEPIDMPPIADDIAATMLGLAAQLGADPSIDPVADAAAIADPQRAARLHRLVDTAVAARGAASLRCDQQATPPQDVHGAAGMATRGLFHASGPFARSLVLDATQRAALPFLRGGWQHRRTRPNFQHTVNPSDADRSTRVFATGERAAITFTLPYQPRHARIRLLIANVLHPAVMTVSANGWELARTPVSDRKCRGSRLDYGVPPEAIQNNRLTVDLAFDRPPPLAASGRHLFELLGCHVDIGDALQPAEVPEDPAILLSRFESLGDNCEFGFVQRRFGVERIGLLTFAGVSDISKLLDLLDGDLAGIGDPGSIVAEEVTATLRGNDGTPFSLQEFFLRDERYGFSFHTFKGPQHHPAVVAIRDNEMKLRFLRRKFIEDLEDGFKIWVFKDSLRDDVNEILSLHASLNRHAPNKLFWVTRAVAGRRPGSVEWIAPGLLRGYSFNPHGDAQWFNAEHWLLLCRRAYAAFNPATS